MEISKPPITPAEQETLDWCASILSEEQYLDCEEDAAEIAAQEIYQDEAAARLVPLLVELKIRHARHQKEIEKCNG